MNLVLILSFASLVITISSSAIVPSYNVTKVHPSYHQRVMSSYQQTMFRSDPRSYGVFRTLFNYIQSGINMLLGRDDKTGRGARKSSRQKISYSGYRVYRITPATKDALENVQGMVDDFDGIKFWTRPAKDSYTDILVPPDTLNDIDEYLRESDLQYEVMIPDVQKLIGFENPKMTKEQRDYLLGKNGHPMTWSRYHRFNDMMRYAEFLVYSHPNLVQLQTIGTSSRGLPLKVIKISSSYRGDLEPDEEKPAIWIDGGMQGREWITSAVVMYIVRQLAENYEKNKRLVDNADWYFLPVANPDGYEYSHSTDRLWTKTRSDHENSAAGLANVLLYGACEGVNMDNNFDYLWGDQGSSDDPCSDFYAGPRPNSEPESKAISDFLLTQKDRMLLYLSFHSYSQQWMLPWSFSKNKGNREDDNEMVALAKKAVQAIAKVAGTKYRVAAMKNSRAPVAGSSDDWAKGVAGVKYSYRVELRDGGEYGYLSPATEIIATSRETFAAVRSIARQLVCKNG